MEDLVWMIGTYMQIYKNDAPGWIVASVVYTEYNIYMEPCYFFGGALLFATLDRFHGNTS